MTTHGTYVLRVRRMVRLMRGTYPLSLDNAFRGRKYDTKGSTIHYSDKQNETHKVAERSRALSGYYDASLSEDALRWFSGDPCETHEVHNPRPVELMLILSSDGNSNCPHLIVACLRFCDTFFTSPLFRDGPPRPCSSPLIGNTRSWG